MRLSALFALPIDNVASTPNIERVVRRALSNVNGGLITAESSNSSTNIGVLVAIIVIAILVGLGLAFSCLFISRRYRARQLQRIGTMNEKTMFAKSWDNSKRYSGGSGRSAVRGNSRRDSYPPRSFSEKGRVRSWPGQAQQVAGKSFV